ncbi:MAG: hypothetical protein ACOC95_07460, partial [Planctomycetota bacterium]
MGRRSRPGKPNRTTDPTAGRGRALAEPLEPRIMLNGTLDVSLMGDLPEPLVPGDVLRPMITMENLSGDDAIRDRAGVDLFLSDDGVLDGNDILLSQRNVRLNLRPADAPRGTTRTMRVVGRVPDNAQPGEDYHLFAQITLQGDPGTEYIAEAGPFDLEYLFGKHREGRPTRLTLLDNNDTTVILALNGPGYGQVVTDGEGDLDIVLTDTAANSVVTIVGRGGRPAVDDITTDAGSSLRMLRAPTTDVSGDIVIDGLQTLIVGDVADEHTITIGGNGMTSIRGGDFVDVNVVAPERYLRSVRVNSWTDTPSSPANGVTALGTGAVRSLGDLNVDWTVTGAQGRFSGMGPVNARGAISGSFDVAAGGRVLLGGSFDGLEAGFDGGLGAIRSRGAFSGDVFATTIGAFIAGGDATGDLGAERINRVAVRGNFNGNISADTIGAFSATGNAAGEFDAERINRVVVGDSFTGGEIMAGTIGAFSARGDTTGDFGAEHLNAFIVGGDFTGGSVAAARIGALTLAGNASGQFTAERLNRFMVRGDLTDAVVAVSEFRTAAFLGNVTNSVILGGGNIGPNGYAGGGDDAIGDPNGGINNLIIRGNVEGAIIAAGIDPVNGNLLDGDDVLAGDETGEYRIRRLTLRGTATDTSIVANLVQLPTWIVVDGQRVRTDESGLVTDVVPTLFLGGDILLSTGISQMIEDHPETVLFEATVDRADPGDRVMLYEADPSTLTWNASDFLLDLFDDGSQAHGDAEAGDGVYSNLLAVSGDTAGTPLAFTAVREATSAESTATIDILAMPSESTLNERGTLAGDTQQTLDQAIGQGINRSTALGQIRQDLLTEPGVNPNSIRTTDDGIFWLTTEGILCGAIENAGTKSDDAAVATAVAPPNVAANITMETMAGDDEPEIRGEAIVLAPFAWDFEPADESDEIATILENAGVDVTIKHNMPQGAATISVDDFKNLGRYEAVVVSTHGTTTGHNVLVNTGDRTSLIEYVTRAPDLITGRLAVVGDYFYITPKFIRHYTGAMNDSIIYMSSCSSTANNTLASAFLSQGAGAYIGYSDTVNTGFANTRGLRSFNHLVEGNTVGTIAGINVDTETDATPAKFMFFGDADATLPTDCRLLNDYELFVEYKWPLNVYDLDTGTS